MRGGYHEKEVKKINGMVIALVTEPGFDEYRVYTKEEWEMGKGYRYAEFEGIQTIREAIEVAENYKA